MGGDKGFSVDMLIGRRMDEEGTERDKEWEWGLSAIGGRKAGRRIVGKRWWEVRFRLDTVRH